MEPIDETFPKIKINAANARVLYHSEVALVAGVPTEQFRYKLTMGDATYILHYRPEIDYERLTVTIDPREPRPLTTEPAE